MKNQVLLAVGVVALAGMAVAAVQDPQRGPRPGGPRGPRDAAALKQELGLSDQQVSQLQKLRMDARKSAIRRHADTRLARLGLQEALQAPSVDEKALQARIKELSDLHAAKLRARVDAQLAMRKLLTPDQQEKLKQLRAERPRPRERFDGPEDRPLERGPRPRRPRPPRGADEGAEPEPLTRPDVR